MRYLVVTAVASLGLLASAKAASKAAVEAVLVEPQKPAPGALCELSVRIKNSGTQALASMELRVKVAGEEIDNYARHSFARNVAAGQTGEVRLYNFYAPAKAGAFEVEVSLVEARWGETSVENGVSSTRMLGPVEGLPVSGRAQMQTGTQTLRKD